jgi:hypothetical protein
MLLSFLGRSARTDITTRVCPCTYELEESERFNPLCTSRRAEVTRFHLLASEPTAISIRFLIVWNDRQLGSLPPGFRCATVQSFNRIWKIICVALTELPPQAAESRYHSEPRATANKGA